MTNFVFTNNDFVLKNENIPSFQFNVPRSDLIVSIYQNQYQNNLKGNHAFKFTPELATPFHFEFVDSETYYFGEDYSPTTDFVIPHYHNIAVDIIVNIGDLVATFDDMTGSFTGEYDSNVSRLMTSQTHSTIEQATVGVDDKTCFVFEQSEGLNVDTCSNLQQALKLFDESCSVFEQTVFFPSHDLCTIKEQAVKLFSKYESLIDELDVFNDLSPCSIINRTQPIHDKTCSIKEQMTNIYPDELCVDFEDMSDSIHSFTESYWDEIVAGDNYKPSHTFTIVGGNEYDDGRGSSVGQIPNEIFTFLPNYVNDQVYSMVNYSRDAVLVDPPIVKLPKIHNYVWNGVWQEFYNSESTQRGGFRLSKCDLSKKATYNDIKNCSIIEETKRPDQGRTPWIDYPRPDPDPNPPSGETITVPIQEVYTMLNTIVVTLDDGTTPIQLNNISLGIDSDSSAWSFSADLIDPSEVSLIKQLPDGTAIKLYITINGYVWHVLVEKITTNRVFGNESVKISGRGLTALLSKPYEQPVSVNFGTDTDIRVIIDNILPLGWNDLGDLYWLLGDNPISSPVSWIVDGGAYSYQNKTSIEAIKEICENIGVVMVPSRDSQEIYFKSRYSVLPWNFSAVSVDVAIPDSAILQLSEEPVSSFQANGVYVHGDEIGGELAFVRLNGTAGDRLAPTTNNSLMTDVAGLRSLGERILSGQYEQPKIKSITTFMDGTLVPLINLGDFVGLTVNSVETKGVVNAVSISARFGEVTQNITIGESTPNTWVAFKEILPKDPMLVGTLASTDGTTSTIALIDGGVVGVRGTGTIGGKYYIRSGEIVSEAPNLTQYEIVL